MCGVVSAKKWVIIMVSCTFYLAQRLTVDNEKRLRDDGGNLIGDDALVPAVIFLFEQLHRQVARPQ